MQEMKGLWVVVALLFGGCGGGKDVKPPSPPVTVHSTSGKAYLTKAVTNDQERVRFMTDFLADLTPEQLDVANAGCQSPNRDDWDSDAGSLKWADLTPGQREAILAGIHNYEDECRQAREMDPNASPAIQLDEIADVSETEVWWIQYVDMDPGGSDKIPVTVCVHVSRNDHTVMLNASMARSDLPTWLLERAPNLVE